MLSSVRSDECNQCLGRVVDAGDELVCSTCGTVTPKEVLEEPQERRLTAVDYTSHSLGSFLGPMEYGFEEIFSKGFSKSLSNFKYLKTVSDFSYKEDSSLYNCAKLIERICEKLVLPRMVVGDSISIAKVAMGLRKGHGEITIAAVSAFSIINACKRLRVSRVGVKEIIEAHRNLGYRVKTSVVNEISIDSALRSRPRRAEEYVASVLVQLETARSGHAAATGPRFNELHEAAMLALENVDVPSRGGHNPRALAATAIYAGEVALARAGGRTKAISQKEIAGCIGMAEYTVREQFVEIFRPRMDKIQGSLRTGATLRPERSTGRGPILLQARQG